MREGDPSFLRTYRENDQGLVICRHGNAKGRFVELMVYGKGGVKGCLVIPEGKQQGGWRGFSAELHHVLEPKQQPINVKGVLPTPAPGTAPIDTTFTAALIHVARRCFHTWKTWSN